MATYVVCIDGTGNIPGVVDEDPVTKQSGVVQTNVERTWRALTGNARMQESSAYGRIAKLQHPNNGEAIYLNGVGTTGSQFEENIQAALGSGTSERIRDGYRFLCERWEEGDKIFLFGFSRGAFAARSLAAFIEFAGLYPDRQIMKEEKLTELYKNYSNKLESDLILATDRVKATVDFLGLWDTVGSLAFGSTFSSYHRLSPKNVSVVRHALALDEYRPQFSPTLWDIASNPKTDVKEVWFAGAHANVGGGYVDTGLSNITLFWILLQARQAGLQGDWSVIDGWNYEEACPIRNSYREFNDKLGKVFSLFGPLNSYLNKEQYRNLTSSCSLHESVIQEIVNETYKPRCLVNNKEFDVTNYQCHPVEPWGSQ